MLLNFRKMSIVVLLVLLLGLILAITYQTSRAWVGIGYKWSTSTGKYDAHTLDSFWVSIVSFGRDQWNNVTPSPWTWLRDDTSTNDVTYGYIDGAGAGTIAGQTTYTLSGSSITRIVMKYDSSENWYLRSGPIPPIGGGQIDARSVTTHEFGHALGLDHPPSLPTPTPSFCPGGSGNATMCLGNNPGTTYKRSLESDDRNGINSLYP